MSVTDHLRGFVRVEGPPLREGGHPRMLWGVINTSTGKVITTDGCCASLQRAWTEAAALTAAARISRMHSFRLKELR